MDKDNIINPFFIGRYAGAKYFCDRKKETETLIKHIVNGRNVALISPRRLGKSGLIHHMFAQERIKGSYTCIYIDIYSTSNLCEFAKALSEGIYKAIRAHQKWHERFFGFIKSLRVGFKMDAITGDTTFEIGIGDINHPEKTISELFEYLESTEMPCIIAVDECQQIRE